jgi:hypothetical protein
MSAKPMYLKLALGYSWGVPIGQRRYMASTNTMLRVTESGETRKLQ